MMPKLTPASGTNQYTNKMLYKEQGGGQKLRKDKDVIRKPEPNATEYNGRIEYAKTMHKYYSESTADSRAETYQPWKASEAKDNRGGYINLSKDDMLTINSHIIQLLNDTFKKEMDKNIVLENTITQLEKENAMYNKRLKELDRAEKNRKDPHYREQLVKISLLIGFGIMLWAGSYYL